MIDGLAVQQHGSGTPLVLVHGSSGGLDSFAPILPLLDGVACWTYARRGYAPSGPCKRPRTFADEVADLRAVLAEVGEPAHVLGASYGAIVGLHAALDGGLRSLSIFEPPLFACGPTLADVLERFRALLAADDLVGAMLLFSAAVARVPQPLLDAMAGSLDPDPAETIGCLHDLEALVANTPDVARWSAVDVPTLLLHGTETWDPMPTTIDALAAALPAVTQVPLIGESHFATHTAPDRFAAAVVEFLSAN